MLLVGLAHFSILPFYISPHASHNAPPPTGGRSFHLFYSYQQLIRVGDVGDGGHGLASMEDLHREKLRPDPAAPGSGPVALTGCFLTGRLSGATQQEM